LLNIEAIFSALANSSTRPRHALAAPMKLAQGLSYSVRVPVALIERILQG
jgi:hypothetical protein